MRWPIRYQLLVPLLTLLLGVVGISTWTVAAGIHRTRQRIETQVHNVAHTLSESRHVPLTHKAVLEQMKGLSGADYLLLTGKDERFTTLPVTPEVLPPVEVVVDDWKTLRLGPRVTVAGETYLGSGVRLPPRADIPAGATLYILYPEERWRSALWEAIRPSLILGGFAGLASIVLAVGVGQRLSRRIQELERRTRLIAAGDFSPMPIPRRNDEIQDLSSSVNEMAHQLAKLQETVQKTERLRLLGQVSGGLAHQLRNGITGTRLAVQLHVRECTADAEALNVALRQLALLETHLKRFLDLGRSVSLRRESCSLSKQIDEIVMLLRPQCLHSHIDLRWRPPADNCLIQGDVGQLEQLLLNVITNAMEAAGPGGSVEVRLRTLVADNHPFDRKLSADIGTARTGPIQQAFDAKEIRSSAPDGLPLDRWCVLEVIDSGPGPDATVADRLFEPFVTSKPEGVGLGLAVARQAAEGHGGKISWRREKERTVFQIELPLASSAAGEGFSQDGDATTKINGTVSLDISRTAVPDNG